MAIKKILITGSSGYVGNFLAIYFGEKGIPVVGLDIAPHPVVKHIKNFSFYQCDVTDKKKMLKIFQEEKPSHVLHLAYLMDPIHDSKREYDIDVNGSYYALECANAVKSVKQFIPLSSTSIYGAHSDNLQWLTEDSPTRPHDYNYAIYKKKIEQWYHDFDRRKDLKMVIFRMCTAVGPSYYKPGGVVSSVAKAPFMLNVSNFPYRVQFIHEDDVKRLFELVMNDTEFEGTFNLCSDSWLTTKKMAHRLKKKRLYLPFWFLKFVFWCLWNLRIAAMTPAIARLMTYSIIASPKKLMKKYNYEFEYSTEEALFDAIEKRRENATL